jgi:hypothetical protein
VCRTLASPRLLIVDLLLVYNLKSRERERKCLVGEEEGRLIFPFLPLFPQKVSKHAFLLLSSSLSWGSSWSSSHWSGILPHLWSPVKLFWGNSSAAGQTTAVNFVGSLAESQAVDTWNSADNAIINSGQEGWLLLEAILLTELPAGWAGDHAACADAGVQVELQGVHDRVSTVDLLGGDAIEDTWQAVADDACCNLGGGEKREREREREGVRDGSGGTMWVRERKGGES